MASRPKISEVPIPISDSGSLCADLNKWLSDRFESGMACCYDITGYREVGKSTEHTRLRIQRSVREFFRARKADVTVHSRPDSANDNFAIFWLTTGKNKRKPKYEEQSI